MPLGAVISVDPHRRRSTHPNLHSHTLSPAVCRHECSYCPEVDDDDDNDAQDGDAHDDRDVHDDDEHARDVHHDRRFYTAMIDTGLLAPIISPACTHHLTCRTLQTPWRRIRGSGGRASVPVASGEELREDAVRGRSTEAVR